MAALRRAEEGRHCRACGARSLALLVRSPVAESRECRSCHSVENGALVDREHLYDESYFRSNYDPVSDAQYQRFAGIVKDVLPRMRSRTLLDVGCGSGTLLRVWADLGHEGAGIDASADAIRLASERLAGSRIRLQPASEPLTGTFGAIAFMDSLAHIERCDEAFAAICAAHLEADGIVIVRTPGYHRLFFAYAGLLSFLLASARLRAAISASVLHAPSRLMLFTRPGLIALLERNGLRVESMVTGSDFKRRKDAPLGLKAWAATLLLERIPTAIRRHASLLVVARKASG